jgi:hypothetical protein
MIMHIGLAQLHRDAFSECGTKGDLIAKPSIDTPVWKAFLLCGPLESTGEAPRADPSRENASQFKS